MILQRALRFQIARDLTAIPKGPKIEKKQSRVKFSISLENFNLDLQNSPTKLGFGGWLACNFQSRLKISIPDRDLDFVNLCATSWVDTVWGGRAGCNGNAHTCSIMPWHFNDIAAPVEPS